ncbi:MAG: TauD/TfdA family dioxygenase [Betaproteobacteria bacterium]|nr:TauD/TfdA family dioxygenase [Betaproteobacteria bacterium]
MQDQTTITPSSARSIQIVPAQVPLGAEVRCGDVPALDETAFREVYRAILDHLVILIRGQTLTDPELIAFGRHFGQLDFAPLARTGKEKARPHPEIIVVSNVLDNGVPIGVLRDAEVVWHSDNSYREKPLSYSALYALEVPATGGDTGFANMYLALETLPADLRHRVEGRTLKHDMTYNSAGDLRAGFTPVADVRDAPGPSHPIIRTHPETGYHALYLGRRPNAYINGLSVAESEEILDALWRHATQPRFTWHHQWRAGDIVIWDNRCVMHHREPFDAGARRIMHRVQCAGDVPRYDPAAKRGSHARAALGSR